jgi:citrate synthase
VTIEYWTARQAADFLGVSLPTLYAYVSRKGIRSAPVPGTRSHRYPRSEIERIRAPRNRGVAAGGAATESSITLITPDRLYYRGRSAIDLAESASFESVAALLWDADVAVFGDASPRGNEIVDQLNRLLHDQPGVSRAMALIPFLERADPRSFDLTPAGMARTGVDILRWLTAIIAGENSAGSEPIHLQFERILGLDSVRSDLVRRLLILSADHGLEEGNYAVRAVASAGVTPWRAVAAGLSVVSGRTSKFERTDSLRRMMAEIAQSSDGAEPILRRIQGGEEIPGFVSQLYAEGDPRARALLGFCDRALASDPSYVRLRSALAVAREYQDLKPNFALASIFAETLIGLPPKGPSMAVSSGEAPFIVGRSAGWIAHAIEQLSLGETGRRQLIYRGPLPDPQGQG